MNTRAVVAVKAFVGLFLAAMAAHSLGTEDASLAPARAEPRAAQAAVPSAPALTAIPVETVAPYQPARMPLSAGPREDAAPALTRVEGLVYDLLTGLPAEGVDLVFWDLGSERITMAATDAQGRYRIGLENPAHRYELRVYRGKRRVEFVQDSDPPMRDLAAQRRRALYARASRSEGALKTFSPSDGAQVQCDLVLLDRAAPSAVSLREGEQHYARAE